MIPKRVEELLEGGSLYWVIKGQVQARQKLLDIRSFKGEDGISRCDLVLGPEVIETSPAPSGRFRAGATFRTTKRRVISAVARAVKTCLPISGVNWPSLGCFDGVGAKRKSRPFAQAAL